MHVLRIQVFLKCNPGTFGARKLDQALLRLGFFRVSKLEDLIKDVTDDFGPHATYEGRRKHQFDGIVLAAIQRQLSEHGYKDAKLSTMSIKKAI